MGIVSDHLRDLIGVQVREHGLVVWFDPEGYYGALATDLELPNTTVARYDGSYFALRRGVDGLLNDERPPRLVVYVGGVSEGETGNALAELTAPGTVMAPGQNPPERNTRFSFVVKTALLRRSQAWTPEGAEEVAAQVEEGKIVSLEEAERVAEKGGTSGVLQVIFGTGLPHEIALALLGSTEHDKKVVAKKATADLQALLASAFAYEVNADATPATIRERLAGHLLRTEFVASIQGQGPLPSTLAGLKVAPEGPAREACVGLVRAWRDSYHLRESYAGWAEHVENELGVASLALDAHTLGECQTFVGLEALVQTALERELVASTGAVAEGRALVVWRLADFWSGWPERYPAVQARWRLISAALELLAMAQEIETGLKSFRGGAVTLLRHYTGSSIGEQDERRGEPLGERPWCLLDTHQRHLERRYHDFSFDAMHETLEKLIARARQHYMDVGDILAQRFVEELKAAKFKAPGVQRQRDVYSESVAPALRAGKTAYVLVDALRFEMARELVGSFGKEIEVTLAPALATLPTITEIGMASLMPRAPEGRVVAVGGGKLGLQVDGTVLKDRASRMAWLEEQVGAKVAIAWLEDILPKPKAALDTKLKAAELIVVTSDEIDDLCEGGNIRLARKVMDDVLVDLAKVVAKLRDYGCNRIIIVADHGYLFGDELESDMKIDPPGGHTDDLHRRVWVGSGGRADSAFLRMSLVDLGLSDSLEVAVPWGFAAFMVPGGARAYFHGGMSPQEIVVPVAVLTPAGAAAASAPPGINWDLTAGSKKISTQFFSVMIEGKFEGLFPAEPPRVRVEVQVKSTVISHVVAAAYGFIEATQEIELRLRGEGGGDVDPNHVTLMIDPAAAATGTTATVLLLDAVTGRTLKRLDGVAVTIAL